MSQITKTTFETLYGTSGTIFPDNTSGDIGADDLRAFGQHISDSIPFLSNAGSIVREVDINSTQLLSGFSSPIEIVPASGSLLVNVPIAFFVYMEYNSAAYATNTSFRFEIDGVAVTGTNTGILPATTNRFAILNCIDIDTATDLSNKAIVLKVQSGNPTAGNSAITVTCIYKVAYKIFP